MLGLIALLFTPAPPAAPMALYAEARAVVDRQAGALWPGLNAAPFRMLLIDGGQEYLVCADPVEGFEAAGTDTETGCTVQTRTAQFDPALLATFPVAGVSTVVIGTPDSTGQSPQAWRQTLLHEHMHQFQDSHPASSYAAVLDLDLHGGDQTGMWMLTYPFPYTDPGVAGAGRQLADAALAALEASDTAFPSALQTYIAARQAFLDRLSDADARYYEFQAWKEGVARWSELALARLDGDAAETARQHERLISELQTLSLPDQERVAFYPLGAADAELLERAGPDWRAGYFNHPFRLAPHFTALAAE